MTVESTPPNPSAKRWEFIWNLTLGFLVSALSVLTAASNYMAFQADNKSSNLESEGDRLLADSNAGYIQANQSIILDYTMFDGEYLQRGVDDFAADYYKGNFSASLQASVDRGSAFDDQYYTEMYSTADQSFSDAFAKLDEANAETERESGFQLAMLIASVGLAFAAYASLLSNARIMRALFTMLAFLMLGVSALQFIVMLVS
ncbi:MAG: hypothetical protein MHPDNHAH_01861 [Anaerolineales bacterium]|nr:hypothetical protein [Anaerolineales bacterium]WKZ49125.1 MAG: hypothetical protein QY306_07120 [Anaerolineales bacterium]